MFPYPIIVSTFIKCMYINLILFNLLTLCVCVSMYMEDPFYAFVCACKDQI